MSPELGTHGCFISNLCTVRFCEETPLAKFDIKIDALRLWREDLRVKSEVFFIDFKTNL
nr:MAG TPA: hypothetical protein [Caudoviricetes sp.]